MGKTYAAQNRTFNVTTPDGVTISVQETGNPDGPEIVFLHGLYQCRLAFEKQFNSDLAKEFHMIAYDFRGHGASDNMLNESHFVYDDGIHYAAELNAVITAANLNRPVLVGWSFGTTIVADYVKNYGTDKLAGICFVGNILLLSTRPEFVGTNNSCFINAMSDDLKTNIQGVQETVHSCFSKKPPEEDLKLMLCYNAMVPTKLRRLLLADRVFNYEETIKTISAPVQIIHGTEDSLANYCMAKRTAELIPNARLSTYNGIGHSPFYEAPERFNEELAAFVRETNS